MDEQLFVSILKEQYHITITDSQLQKLEKYYEMLVNTNEKINLTAITKKEEVYEKHFFDSLLPFSNIDLTNKSLIDVGSGAGFPGLVLAIVYENCNVTLLEPTQKRVNFLNQVILELNLKNVNTICSRAEDYVHSKDFTPFDYATARAVSRLNVLLELVIPLLKVKGIFIALKGKATPEEVKEANRALNVLNSEIVTSNHYCLPSDTSERYSLKIVKLEKTNIKYPRSYGRIKKDPL